MTDQTEQTDQPDRTDQAAPAGQRLRRRGVPPEVLPELVITPEEAAELKALVGDAENRVELLVLMQKVKAAAVSHGYNLAVDAQTGNPTS